ncbi:hypothetical protein [Microbacterium oleivorans]|uniref:hypothetical protein n=1 Tax=Microbacterium TaxID=33882 RepID=UPI002041704D|nr:hypothetical protein [Microbacterium oleivorans]MCM3695231.1 hypothetical protein [Microbacterium oleivorans]
MRIRLFAALAGSFVVATALVACATPASRGVAPGGGADAVAPAARIDAGWLDGGATIGVVTYGSSSCRPEVSTVADDNGVILIALSEPAAPACTDDLVARALEVPVPSGVDATADQRIRVELEDVRTDIDLPAYGGGAVEEFAPSASWIGDRVIALRTWGSSSCLPVVEDTRVESPASVVVRFATPPADQVCTMDMAPQLTLVQLDPDAEVDRDATLSFGVLDAAETVPIR